MQYHCVAQLDLKLMILLLHLPQQLGLQACITVATLLMEMLKVPSPGKCLLSTYYADSAMTWG